MKKILLLIVLLVLPMANAMAVKVASLYQVELPVMSQSTDDRDQATKRGFLQVLVKLSGDPDIEKNSAIKEALKRAEYYVQDFSYSAPTTTSSQYFVKIRFDKDDTNSLLKKAGVTFWGVNRPLILVWMTYTADGKAPEIISNESSIDILDDLRTTGKKYGLPLIFPILDITDVNQVAPEDITNMTLPTLTEAGKRYAPDALLIGNVKQGKDGYQSDWQLVLMNDKWHWSLNDKNTENIADSLFNQVSQTLASRYVTQPGQQSQVWLRLEVSNVTRRNDFKLLMQYLKQVASVQQIQLSQVTGDVVELLVQIEGPVATFLQNAAIGQHLVLKTQDKNELDYDWVH